MTTSAEISEDTSLSESAVDASYMVDEQAYEDAGEDYLFKVWQRLCWSGGCRLCRRFPDGKPIVPGNTTVTSIYNASRTCPGKVQFINPGMSLLEAVFRILIINGNKPLKFEEIVDRLREHWGAEFQQRVESTDSLKRMLDSANEYRIARVSSDD